MEEGSSDGEGGSDGEAASDDLLLLPRHFCCSTLSFVSFALGEDSDLSLSENGDVSSSLSLKMEIWIRNRVLFFFLFSGAGTALTELKLDMVWVILISFLIVCTVM